jgi:hypothetical protein
MTAFKPRFFALETIVGTGSIALIVSALWYVAARDALAAKLVFAIALFFFGMMCLVVLVYALKPNTLAKELTDSAGKGETGAYHVVGVPVMYLASFLLCSFTMWRIWGAGAFTSGASSPSLWLKWLADNLVRSVLFDVAETFYLDISPIDQAKRFWPCVFVFTFRTLTSVAMIRVVVMAWLGVRERTD